MDRKREVKKETKIDKQKSLIQEEQRNGSFASHKLKCSFLFILAHVETVCKALQQNTGDCLDLIIEYSHSTYSIHVPYVASATDLTHELQKTTVLPSQNSWFMNFPTMRKCKWRGCNILELPSPEPTRAGTELQAYTQFKGTSLLPKLRTDQGPPQGQLLIWFRIPA